MNKLAPNKLILSILCVVIGLAPLIAFVNTLESGKQMLKRELPDKSSMILKVDLTGSNAVYKDFAMLAEQMPEIKDVIPVSKSNTIISSYKDKAAVALKAVGSGYEEYAGLYMSKGKFITKEQFENNQKVIVIDDLTADKLYGTTEVLGRKLELVFDNSRTEVVVIGVCKRLDMAEARQERDQGLAYIPITVLDNAIDQYNMQKTILSIKGLKLEEASARISHFLAGRDIEVSTESIKLINQFEYIEAFTAENRVMFLAMAFLWLLVASVGLINIMLLEVEQCKKYYGLLKFYGSESKSIKRLVYYKAYIIALVSGVCSIFLGILTSFVACYFLNISLYISVYSLTIGLLLSILLCMAASIYPAYNASETDVNSIIWQLE